jgi:hypothetical protein
MLKAPRHEDIGRLCYSNQLRQSTKWVQMDAQVQPAGALPRSKDAKRLD